MYSFWLLPTSAALALQARAQDLLGRLPQCAFNCSSHFIEQIPCSATDKGCLCNDTEVLVTGISECAKAGCKVRDILFSTNTTLLYCDVPRRDGSQILDIITGIFGGLALLVVLLRMVTRMRPFKTVFGWDDGLIISVMAAAVVISAFQFVMTHYGYGRDIFTIQPDNISTILKIFFAGELLYNFAIIVTKISILCFYLRIFQDQSFKKRIHILIGACTVYFITSTTPGIWQCTPISYIWTSWSGETEGHCINVFLLTWTSASINILLDLAVIFLPVRQLLNLTLSTKKKIQIIAMFCVGLFVTLCSVVRLHSLIKFRSTLNFSWDYLAISYMSMLEMDVGIICACMPAMQLLLRRVAPRLFGSTVDANSYVHPHTSSRMRTYRNTNSHMQSKSGITKTITTTVTGVSKGSDSIIELVDTSRNSEEGVSLATVSTETKQILSRNRFK